MSRPALAVLALVFSGLGCEAHQHVRWGSGVEALTGPIPDPEFRLRTRPADLERTQETMVPVGGYVRLVVDAICVPGVAPGPHTVAFLAAKTAHPIVAELEDAVRGRDRLLERAWAAEPRTLEIDGTSGCDRMGFKTPLMPIGGDEEPNPSLVLAIGRGKHEVPSTGGALDHTRLVLRGFRGPEQLSAVITARIPFERDRVGRFFVPDAGLRFVSFLEPVVRVGEDGRVLELGLAPNDCRRAPDVVRHQIGSGELTLDKTFVTLKERNEKCARRVQPYVVWHVESTAVNPAPQDLWRSVRAIAADARKGLAHGGLALIRDDVKQLKAATPAVLSAAQLELYERVGEGLELAAQSLGAKKLPKEEACRAAGLLSPVVRQDTASRWKIDADTRGALESLSQSLDVACGDHERMAKAHAVLTLFEQRLVEREKLVERMAGALLAFQNRMLCDLELPLRGMLLDRNIGDEDRCVVEWRSGRCQTSSQLAVLGTSQIPTARTTAPPRLKQRLAELERAPLSTLLSGPVLTSLAAYYAQQSWGTARATAVAGLGHQKRRGIDPTALLAGQSSALIKDPRASVTSVLWLVEEGWLDWNAYAAALDNDQTALEPLLSLDERDQLRRALSNAPAWTKLETELMGINYVSGVPVPIEPGPPQNASACTTFADCFARLSHAELKASVERRDGPPVFFCEASRVAWRKTPDGTSCQVSLMPKAGLDARNLCLPPEESAWSNPGPASKKAAERWLRATLDEALWHGVSPARWRTDLALLKKKLVR